MTSISSGHRIEIEVESQVRAFLVNEQTLPAELLISIDNLIGGNRVGDAFDRDVPTLLAVDAMANARVSLIGHEDLARCSRSFKPGSEVHATTNDSVVHAILATKVPDSAKPCVDSNPALEWLLNAGRSPYVLQLAHPLPHGYGHLDAGEGVFIDAACFRIAEEDDDGVANVFIDCRSIQEGDL